MCENYTDKTLKCVRRYDIFRLQASRRLWRHWALTSFPSELRGEAIDSATFVYLYLRQVLQYLWRENHSPVVMEKFHVDLVLLQRWVVWLAGPSLLGFDKRVTPSHPYDIQANRLLNRTIICSLIAQSVADLNEPRQTTLFNLRQACRAFKNAVEPFVMFLPMECCWYTLSDFCQRVRSDGSDKFGQMVPQAKVVGVEPRDLVWGVWHHRYIVLWLRLDTASAFLEIHRTQGVAYAQTLWASFRLVPPSSITGNNFVRVSPSRPAYHSNEERHMQANTAAVRALFAYDHCSPHLPVLRHVCLLLQLLGDRFGTYKLFSNNCYMFSFAIWLLIELSHPSCFGLSMMEPDDAPVFDDLRHELWRTNRRKVSTLLQFYGRAVLWKVFGMVHRGMRRRPALSILNSVHNRYLCDLSGQEAHVLWVYY
jgi:hypothetical protein